ncbi:glycosyltransferase [Brumimicrobium salinarum]|uniref:glycosyltransferase n=1 Tax=Brumimicrobium salinarum TaxID=2058658 RepID=UPI0013FE15FE|nr:glycosyltransferase [Brumimicrobium salinarum]
MKELTLLVPFRDEEKNLPQLLESLYNQTVQPEYLIFVNDHSSDYSVSIIQAYQSKLSNIKLLHLSEDKTGKKSALKKGIAELETRYVLTLDADVKLSSNYFETLAYLSSNTIIGLPVIMESCNGFGQIIKAEHLFFNAFNYLISAVWPISLSGANLLIDTSQIDYNAQLKEHEHIASGDDYFLLQHARKKGIPIAINNDFNLSATTESPRDLSSYLQQRIRWLSKGKLKVNWTDLVIGAFIPVYFFGGIIVLIYEVIQLNWIGVLTVLVLRFLLDAFVLINYAQTLRQTKIVFILPLFQIVYPFLFLMVLIGSIFYKPTWKKRRI